MTEYYFGDIPEGKTPKSKLVSGQQYSFIIEDIEDKTDSKGRDYTKAVYCITEGPCTGRKIYDWIWHQSSIYHAKRLAGLARAVNAFDAGKVDTDKMMGKQFKAKYFDALDQDGNVKLNDKGYPEPDVKYFEPINGTPRPPVVKPVLEPVVTKSSPQDEEIPF